MIDIGTEVDALASWPTRERIRALKRIIPRARVEEVLARTGHDRARCRRLPGWFLVWFVIALGLFCRDCYRQVFRWRTSETVRKLRKFRSQSKSMSRRRNRRR